MNDERIRISGGALEGTGWKKDGFRWSKGWSELTYDGVWWKYCYAIEDVVPVIGEGVKITWRVVEYMDEIKKF